MYWHLISFYTRLKMGNVIEIQDIISLYEKTS